VAVTVVAEAHSRRFPRSFSHAVPTFWGVRVVTAKSRGEHTSWPPQCCGKHPAYRARLFVCWQTQSLLKSRPCQTHALCINARSFTPVASRETRFQLLQPPLLFHDFRPEVSRDSRRGRSRRRARILLGTHDRMTVTEELSIDPLWGRPTAIYQGRTGGRILFCRSKRPALWTHS
jgi:hypothetical protein